MAISVRLSAESETKRRGFSHRRGQPLSEFVREAIEEKLRREEHDLGAYALGKDLFGRYASGDGSRSIDRKQQIRKKIVIVHTPSYSPLLQRGGLNGYG